AGDPGAVDGEDHVPGPEIAIGGGGAGKGLLEHHATVSVEPLAFAHLPGHGSELRPEHGSPTEPAVAVRGSGGRHGPESSQDQTRCHCSAKAHRDDSVGPVGSVARQARCGHKWSLSTAVASALREPSPLHPVIRDGQPGYLALLIALEADDASVGGFLHV